MVRKLLLILFIALVATLELSAQATLRGTVTDEAKGETLIGTYVTVKSGGKATTVVTDLDGNYNINLEPGKYQVEATYLGYAKSQINDVLVKAGQANVLDIKLSNDDKVLNTVVISIYKVPLIEQDKTTSGGVLTSEQIRTSPLRDINSLAANTAGLSAIDGGNVTIKGSRSDATAYILDGIRVRGALPPSLEIEQLQVITGGIEAQYGDVTGGIISVTSKGPASKFSGALEAETSKYLDPYGQSLFNLNLSGPIIRNKNKTESILGFRISAQ